ncbi:Hypothetical_protein [Hexamita inflata]|uniref:Hypothetical_protein n=1 Tax=Hexamita inflata TaxID=28002 RepID=A0ABP1HHQ1_9EUKA
MNDKQRILKSQLQKQLLNTGPDMITYEVMMLQNISYYRCFVTASFALNIDIYDLLQTFKEIVMNELVQQKLYPKLNQQLLIKDENIKVNDRTIFKLQFEQSAKEVLFRNQRLQNMNCEDLCRYINQYLELNNNKLFWNQIQQLIPYKSEKQLREYYQKSFQRVMFTEFTDDEDKQFLKQMLENKPNKPAAQLADEFLSVCKCETTSNEIQ